MQTPQRIGLIGHGAIGQSLIRAWPHHQPQQSQHLAAVLVRPHQVDQARARIPAHITVTTSLRELLSLAPDLVIEAAGHAAVAEHAEAVLQHGARLMLLSIGALADPVLSARLQHAAQRHGTKVVLPVGATAGLDGLRALQQAGLHSVHYSATKPPRSWRGTPAEELFDLQALKVKTVLFEGNARDAARLYPKNANLTAAVALAGLGFERTRVQLIADPDALHNIGHLQAQGASSRLEVTVSGSSSPHNPKTSQVTGMSVLSALANQAQALCFG